MSPREGAGGRSSPSAAIGPEEDDVADLRRVRRGDRAAYDALFARHVGAAQRVARSLLRDPAAAEDAVAEAFAQTYAAIRRGRGPVDGFDAYLLRSVRHHCFRTWRRQAHVAPGVDPAPAPTADGLDERLDADVMRTAFRGLPGRMRLVLWRTEVEGCSHAEIAEQLHTSPQAVAALAVRARRQLAADYLQGHTASASATECAAVRRAFAVVVRGTASARTRASIEEHLAGCPPCQAAYDELVLVNERLRTGPLGGALASFASMGPISVGARVASLLAVAAGGMMPVAGVLTLSVAIVAAEPVATDDSARDTGAATATLALRTPPATVVVTSSDGPAGGRVDTSGAVAELRIDLAADPVAVATITSSPPPGPAGAVVDPVAPSTGPAATPAPAADLHPATSPPVGPGLDGRPAPVLAGSVAPVADDGPRPVVQPIAERVVAPVVGDVVEPAVDPIVDEVEPVIDDVVEPIVDDVVEPIVDDVVEPIVDDVVEPIVGDVVGPIVGTPPPPLEPAG